MTSVRRVCVTVSACLLVFALWSPAPDAQTFAPGFLNEMKWRNIGPHRASRTKAAAGVPSQPNVFYIGACCGSARALSTLTKRWRGNWQARGDGRTSTGSGDSAPTAACLGGSAFSAVDQPQEGIR